MADTGFSADMAASTDGVDVEIDSLIKAVVERGSRRKEAVTKRFVGAVPQWRAAGEMGGQAQDVRPQDELNSLIDEVRRDKATHPKAPAQAAPKPWLLDAVISKQDAESRGYSGVGTPEEYFSQQAEAADQETKTQTDGRGFGANPFKKAGAVAAALPVAGALALGRTEDERPEPKPEIVAEPEIAGDAFARDLIAHDERIAEFPVEAPSEDFAETETEPAHDRLDDDGYAAVLLGEDTQTPEAMPVGAVQAQSTGSDGSGGVPVWLTMGIPVAAVSMAALVAGVHVVREAGAEDVPIEAASLAPMTVSYAEAGAATLPDAPEPLAQIDGGPASEAMVLASAPSALPSPTLAETEITLEPALNINSERTIAEAMPDLSPAVSDQASDEPAQIVEASAPVPRTAPEPEPAIDPQPDIIPGADFPFEPSAPSVKPDLPQTRSASAEPVRAPRSSAPERADAGNVPSLKPQFVSLPRQTGTAPVASDAVFRPRTGSVPVRMFDGHFEKGSAALIVNSVAANMGGPLSQTQQSWLARDMERALDRELDGRDVSLKSDRGDRIAVLFADSAQELRQMPVARERGVAALPDQMVLEGGWYAARTDAALRPTPSLFGTFRNRAVPKGALIERMATVTDRYGDRWYLMGQRGVAIGYMSPAELVLAEAAPEPLGLPLERRVGDVVQDMVPVFTRCRTVFVGPWGETRQKMDVCRNAKGNWVGARTGQVPVQQAIAERPEPIVLASAAGQSAELAPFETAKVRKSLAPKLVYGRAGQVITQQLADGRDVEMKLGAKFETTRDVPVMRLEALGRIDEPLRLDARWMRVPGGARLRATPDYLTEVNLGALAAGSAVETIGSIVNDRGEEWVLVGRDGVGFGYVQRQELMPLAGSTALRAIPSAHTAAVVDIVEAIADCRSVEYLGAGLEGTLTACQVPDGQWSLSAEPALRQLVDLEPSSRIAP